MKALRSYMKNERREQTAMLVRSELFAMAHQQSSEGSNYFVRGWLSAAQAAEWITPTEKHHAELMLNGETGPNWASAWWKSSKELVA